MSAAYAAVSDLQRRLFCVTIVGINIRERGEASVTVKYPLQLQPDVRERVWGGRWLADKLGRNGAEGANLGESWEAFSGSIIVNGEWQGQTLGQWFAQAENTNARADIVGTCAASYAQFPLLAKFLDARENLSIQVHPNDALAQQLENYPFGKTEFWYILDAVPDAHIYYGLNAPDISREELRLALANNDLLRYLNRVPVRAGDVVFMPAGTVHALTAGIVAYELQQDSDITYRLYDWGRADREIHHDKGALSIDPACANMSITRPRFRAHRTMEIASLVSCAYFHSEIWRVHDPVQASAPSESFVLLSVLSSQGRITSPKGQFPVGCLQPGTTLCLPAGLDYVLQPDYQNNSATLEVITGWMAA